MIDSFTAYTGQDMKQQQVGLQIIEVSYSAQGLGSSWKYESSIALLDVSLLFGSIINNFWSWKQNIAGNSAAAFPLLKFSNNNFK